MQNLIFQLRRILLSLSDAFLFPFRRLRELWSDPGRGRSLLFGLPAFFTAFAAIVLMLLAMNSKERFVSNYETVKEKAEQEENWAEAIVYTRKLAQLRPDDDATKWELARVLDRDDREDSAQASKQTATAIRNSLSPEDRPRYPAAHIWRASVNLMDRRQRPETRLRAAEEQLRFALSTDPDNADAKLLLAQRILIPRRKYQEALDIYLELFKEYPGYYIKLAELFVVMKRPEEATPYIEEAIVRYDRLLADDPDNVDYLRRRANAHAMLARYDEAIRLLREAMDAADNEASKKHLASALSQIYLARGRTRRAQINTPEGRQGYLENMILAYEVDPANDDARTELTRYGNSGFEDAERAREIYDPRDNPDEAPDEALQMVGTRELVKGDKQLGVQLLELAIQKNPRNHEALNNLAFVMMETDLERAFDLADRAVALQPRNFQYLDTRGNIYMRQGNYAKAIIDLEKAVIGMTDNVAVYEALVNCYTQQGMLRAAASYQEKVDELRGKGEN